MLKKILKNKSLVTIIAGIVCLAILFFAYRYRVNTAIRAVTIPVAAVEIPARTEITEDKIKTIKVASAMLSSNVITNKKNIIGKYVDYNTFIPEGGLFYTSSVVNWSSMPDSAWSNIPEGNTIVSLSVNSKTTFGNSIFPGDKIDLYYKTNVSKSGNTYLVLGKLIEGIEVLAVKDSSGKHIFKKGPEQTSAAALIFSVPEDYHLLLKKALYLDGEIIPVPRNATYDKETTISSEYLRELIEKDTIDIQPDAVEEDYSDIQITE